MANFYRSAWFPLLLSACRLAEFDTVVICHVFMHCLGSFLLPDMLLNHHELAFEGLNMKFTVNMLLTCILYRSLGPAAITTVCNFSRSEPFIVTDNIFCSREIFLGDDVAFLRESYTFVYVMFLAAFFPLLDV